VLVKLLRVPRAPTTLLEGLMLSGPDLCHYQLKKQRRMWMYFRVSTALMPSNRREMNVRILLKI